MPASRRAALIAAIVVLVSLGFVPAAQAATTITRAELSGTSVRIEGSGATPNARLVVNGGVLTGTADSGGRFRIESSNFSKPADCKVTVTDGTTSATSTLSGCSVSQPSPNPPPPPPSSAPVLTALSVSPTDVVGPNPATAFYSTSIDKPD